MSSLFGRALRTQQPLQRRGVLSAPRGRTVVMSSANAGRRSGLGECCPSLARHRRRRWTIAMGGGPWHSSPLAARTFLAASPSNDENTGSTFDDDEASSRTPPRPPPATASFRELGLHPVLVERLQTQLGITVPTPVQATAFPALRQAQDVTIGSETGSGKTLAYLLPIMHDILTRRDELTKQSSATSTSSPHEYARALILVPNKELVQQVVRMAVPLAGGPHAVVSSASSVASSTSTSTTSNDDDEQLIRLAVLPGGLDDPDDFRPFRDALQKLSAPPDIVVSTPASVAPWGLRPKCIGFFADLQTIVVDEADMCVDGGYIRAVEQVLLGFKRSDRMLAKYQVDESAQEESHLSPSLLGGAIPSKRTQHVFVAATLPDYGLRSVAAWLSRKFPRMVRVETDDLHRARHSGLTETTQWIQLESKKERMQHLVDLLQDELSHDKVMVFCNSVDDVESVAEALQRVGFENAVPYHAKLSLPDRTQNLERFRSYQPSSSEGLATASSSSSSTNPTDVVVLVCTDLASRGLDVPGVTAVVQLQFAGNAVAHLHRMGRCGRAHTERGRGVVYYGAQESELVQVLRDAEVQQEQGSSSLQLSGEIKDEAAWNDPVDDDDDDDDDVDDRESTGRALPSPSEDGSIRNAFSRKRGFTKKRKKLRSSTTGMD